MITNDVQYRTAKTQVDRLDRLVGELVKRNVEEGDELRRNLEVAAVESQLNELRAQLMEYDALREGRVAVGEFSSLDDLPRLLVRARIAAGLSQRLLAERLGLKEQQIQRYESSDYESASLSRLRQIAAAVGVSNSSLPSEPHNSEELIKQLMDLGLDRNVVRRRIAPAALREQREGQQGEGTVIELASRISRVFGMDTSDVLSGNRIATDDRVLAAANFKMPQGVIKKRVAAYTVYAHYMALVVLQGTQDLARSDIPKEPRTFRSLWEESGFGLGFDGLIGFVWSLGVPVLPLADSGGFHAAVWRAHGREIVVLKQGARQSSRWEFDLLHEIGHIVSDLDGPSGGVIDGDDMSIEDGEQAANQFAGEVLLDGQAESLVSLCVEEANGSVERLKRVVPRVASAEGVDRGALANYMAFRLSLQGINWWGAAHNLQVQDEDPWAVCRDALIRNADLASLNPLDRELLNQALIP